MIWSRMTVACSFTFSASGDGAASASLTITLSGVLSAWARLPTCVRARSTMSRLAPIEQVQLVDQRRDFDGIAPGDAFARAAPDLAKLAFQHAQRAQTKSHLERGGDGERDGEQREGDGEGEAKAVDVVLDLFGVAGDLHQINAGVAHVDHTLDDAQQPAVRPRRRPAPRAAGLGNDPEIGQFGQLRREQRARRHDFVLFVVGPRDLPIPAGIGQFELRFAKLAGAATFLARLRHMGDDGAQIDFEPAFEHVFRVAPIILRQQQGSDQQKQETQPRGGEKQPPGD